MGFKHWCVAVLETNIPWPTEEISTSFMGKDIYLRPATEEHAPDVSLYHLVNNPGIPWEKELELRKILMMFLSALSWTEKRLARIIFYTGGSARMPGGKVQKFGPPENLYISREPERYFAQLPKPKDEKTWLALALYREALCLNCFPYKFLAFFKILNIRHETGQDIKSWINRNIAGCITDKSDKRLKELQCSDIDIGNYLYEVGRCAIAHAYRKPLVNPDDEEHLVRIRSDIDLIQALAEKYINEMLSA